MKITRASILNIIGLAVTISVLAGLFYFRALENESNLDYHKTNFFTFWLPGRMLLNGENPYNETQWLAGHDAYDVTWRPNKIFPYPLPLALLLVPLGLLPIREAYIVWEIISQVVIAVVVYSLLNHWKDASHRRIFAPLAIAFLFFGPVYLTLKIGTVGVLALAALFATLILLDKGHSLAAGVILAALMLKPPQGLTILILIGTWFLARRDWKGIWGMLGGGAGLFLIGVALDPLWLIKFRGAGEAVLDRTLGVHSNVWSLSYLACNKNWTCSIALGAAACTALLGWGSYYLIRNRARLTAWEAFNVIIPIGFISTIYLWGYDQLTYIIPITWIVGELIERKKSYILAALFMILLDFLSMALLFQQAVTQRDVGNVSVTIIILGLCLWLMKGTPPAGTGIRMG